MKKCSTFYTNGNYKWKIDTAVLSQVVKIPNVDIIKHCVEQQKLSVTVL